MVKRIEGENKAVNSSQKCAVCMEKNAYATIDCPHRFCMRCITRWSNVFFSIFQRNSTCPLCRA